MIESLKDRLERFEVEIAQLQTELHKAKETIKTKMNPKVIEGNSLTEKQVISIIKAQVTERDIIDIVNAQSRLKKVAPALSEDDTARIIKEVVNINFVNNLYGKK